MRQEIQVAIGCAEGQLQRQQERRGIDLCSEIGAGCTLLERQPEDDDKFAV